MAFIINNRGEKVHVDMEIDWFSQKCALYADGAELINYYILNLYEGTEMRNKEQPELIVQIEYRNEPPTKNEIMYQMWKHGLSRFDIATIESGYMLDWKDD